MRSIGIGMELNPQQRAAVEHEGGHALVLAGAGTGKTTTVVARVAHLIRCGVTADRILLLTFTRRAAREMQHRLVQLSGATAKSVQAGTFHRFCLQSIRRWPRHFGFDNHAVIDRDDSVQLMKMCRAEFAKKDKQFPKSPKLVNLYSFARNTNQPVSDYLENYTEHDEETRGRIVKVFQGYKERKAASRYLDYDDILHVVARRLHADPTTRDRLRGLFDHILVDEMQDTNPLQWLVLDGIRDPGKLFCVGDDAQSIYAFRGADFRNVHAFTERIPGSTVLKLEHNYRSTQEILDLSNWLLAESSLRYDKKLVAVRGAGNAPRMVDCDSDLDEAAWIGDDLVERHEGGARWGDHMILTRTGYGARSVEAVLVERSIPYRFIGGTSLLQSAHVKDLLSLVRAVDSPADELAWMRFLTLWEGIGDVRASKAVEDMRGIRDTDKAIEYVGERFRGKSDMIGVLRQVRADWDRPSDAIGSASEALTPLLEPRYDRWEIRRRDFELLQRLARQHRTVRGFIETYTLDPISESEAQRSDADDLVTLITVHSAKGTEAPVCYIIQLQPGTYPHVRSVAQQEGIEEERRTLYVAMTRAKNELIMTRTSRVGNSFVPHGGRRWISDQAEGDYFLARVPEALIDWESGEFNGLDLDDMILPFDREL